MKKNLLLLLISVSVSIVFLELAIMLCVSFLNLNIDKPAYSFNAVRYRFWADISPEWGTWHEKYSKYNLIKSCINVNYQANSYGARDKERCLESSHRRVAVLGDSFIEGYGVEDERRVTNLLEKRTGIEHMNFATSGGFGPTQELLVYKNLAKKFDHQTVMIWILPFNDFYDDDYDFGKKVYSKRYRPYLDGEYPNYNLVYTNPKATEKSPVKAFLRGYTYTFNAWERLVSVMKVKSSMPDQNSKGYSGYYDYTVSQLNKLKYVLKELKEEAKGKKVVLVTIPVISDFIRYEVSREAPLSKELGKFSKEVGITYIDLLPEMFEGDWQRYKLPCDNHWSEYGNQVVSDLILKHMRYP